MGLLSWLLGSNEEDSEQEYHADMHEIYHGERPNRKLTEDEIWELEALYDDAWEEEED